MLEYFSRKLKNYHLNKLTKEFWFSEWYEIAYTLKSYILENKDLYNGVIDILPNKQCFARLDTLSSKPLGSYKNSQEIEADLKKSYRTKDYVELDFEFRCFIHEKKLRAISSEQTLTNTNIEEIKVLVDRITFFTEYESYCVDLTYYKKKLMVIEINTPVWLFATSGLFCLDEPADFNLSSC